MVHYLVDVGAPKTGVYFAPDYLCEGFQYIPCPIDVSKYALCQFEIARWS